MKQFYFIFSLILATSFSQLNADILYVKPGTTSTAWQNQTNVYSDFQTALASAVAGDEVWVAAGIYKPTTGGNRDISFELKDGVHYYGGFVGDETELSQRNWRDNETILSGDIGVEGDDTDNSYHVVKMSGTAEAPITETTIIDGMMIEMGCANDYSSVNDGGGMLLISASPIVRNVWFRNNYASDDGGAIYGDNESHAKFGNVLFTDNESGDDGGAAYVTGNLNFYNCVWYGNYSGYWGGAVYGNSSVSVTNSIAWENIAERSSNDYSSSVNVTNSIFIDATGYNENINENPGFMAANQYDFRLRSGSPAINAGNNNNVPEWLSKDFYDAERIQDEIVNMGISEGFVVTPELLSPANSTYLESDQTSALLEWGWSETQPVDVESYIVEFSINGGEPVFVDSPGNYSSYTLTGLNPASIVQWRVASVDASGAENWSELNRFVVLRGHPLHVKPGATGSGTSWADAVDLSEALKMALPGEQIWVAAGTYLPTEGTSRRESFKIMYDLTLLGGFSGDEISPDERDWNQNQTILSGDIGVEGDNTDNSFHVIELLGSFEAPITEASLIDGIIIEQGYTGYSAILRGGGGMLFQHASPVVRNVIFRDNTARYGDGGAVYGDDFSAASFGNVLFHNNSATYYRGRGGAVYDKGGFTFYNCLWHENYSSYDGGAVHGKSVIVNSIAWNNLAEERYNDFYSQVTKRNTLYADAGNSNGNISEDPALVAPDKGDFRIRVGSPALNAGNNEDVPEWLTKDFFGAERIRDGVVDMGVSEGVVETPELLSPADSTVFEQDQSGVLLEWGWSESQPAGVDSYMVEFSINGGEPVFVEGLGSLSYMLTALNPATVVQWRVASVDVSGSENWSELYRFVVLRGHPLHVTPDGTGTGSSWSDGMNLQSAIDASMQGDSIWVAKGVYHPTNTTDRSISFELREHAKIFGGFEGDETDFLERNWVANETILSGNIGNEGLRTDNSYRVVRALGTAKEPITDNTVLDGLIIEEGFRFSGAGIYLGEASILVRNLWFRNNFSTSDGGAVRINSDCKPKFGNVLFTGNSSDYDGGAVYARGHAEFYNCTWYGNSAGGRGGSVYGDAIITNSISWKNYSGMYDNEFSSSNDVRNSIYETRDETNGNVSVDPMFVAPEKNDFRLLAASPGVNAGVNEDVPEWLTMDWFGTDRIQENIVDVGMSEGGVLTPVLLSPADQTYFESGNSSVLLEWGWDETQPSDVVSYAVEFSVNEEEPLLMENIQGLNYTLAGLSPGSAVSWRVCSVDASGRKTWSEQYHFSILRGHPLYVTPNGVGAGTSWTDAMSLQEAMNSTVDGDSVWVAEGIYKPTETTDRDIFFVLTENIKMFGGFAGTETEFSERNHIINETILSGDIGEVGVNTDNSYHVLYAVGTTKERDDWNAVVDGFTVEGGYADGSGHNNGGGLYLNWASPLFVNVHFRNNYAFYDGGAVFDAVGSQAEFANVLFTGNSSDRDGGAVYANKLLRYYNCVWFNNSSVRGGGGAYGRNEIVNSIFWKNQTENNYNNDLNRLELVSYTIFDNGNSHNNLKGNPGFIDAGNGDFRIREESLALNAGSNEAVPEWLSTDYYGNSRILGDTLDLGISEGAVIGPVLLAPEDQSVLFIEDGEPVMLEWILEDSEVAATISEYQLRYVLGGDTSLVENITENQYELSGLMPLDSVEWSVGFADGSGNINWSAYASFYIYRGHPLFVMPGGSGDGSSWATAINLQDALGMAVTGDSIWVAKGVYKPTEDANREASINMKDGVRIFGGFKGDELTFDQRNWVKNKTILSGDIGVEGDKTDNSYHVVKATGTTEYPFSSSGQLDGFFIEDGYADGSYSAFSGGGLFLSFASPLIKNVCFRNNFALANGGAVVGLEEGKAQFGNVIFTNNESGGSGGAVAVYSYTEFKFFNCLWYDNSSGFRGGATWGDISVINSIAWENKAEQWDNDFSGNYAVSNSIYPSARKVNGNSSENPDFVDVKNFDFRLKEGSPAINAGNTEIFHDWLTEDYYGNSRILGDTIDIGVAEGGVIVPTILSPEEGSVASIEESAQVLLEWTVDAPFAEDISSYQIEYVVNSDTFLVENIAAQQYALSGLQSLDSVSWRVGYQDGTGLINWSSESSFIIRRGHPIYVMPNGTGDGSSWANAMDLEAALQVAVKEDSVWIAAGTYKPTKTTDRNISFVIDDNIKLFGGFAGTETLFEERNLIHNQVILSGDIGEVGVDTDNSYHVVQIIGSLTDPITQNTVIDGVVIEKGYADEQYMDGGGLLLEWASPIVRNVWLRGNYAVDDGGAVYGNYESQAQFGNVIFTDNESGDDGGAVYSQGNMQFHNCVWYGNISGDEGGAVYGNNAIVNNSIAWGNSAVWAYNDFSYWVDVTTSIYSGAYSGDGNFSQNPGFIDAENADFRLKEGSPAINAGSTEDVPDWMITDYHGYSRIQGDIVDIGISEGWVISPILVSPADNSYLDAGVSGTTLEWGWNDSIPDNITGFAVEYIINGGEPQLLENLTALDTELTGIQSADEVSWRVGSIEDTGFTNWSESRTFTVYRDHPLYVKPGARGNGTSWLNAMDLKDAVEIAIKNDEIWVAAGTYKPTDDADRDATFELNNGVKLYGGFRGYESSVEERDWMANQTILSGDIGVEGDVNDNSYNVVRIRGAEDNLFEGNIVDGFIIEKGKAQYDGGGIYIRWSTPELRNIWLRDNQADRWGGAVYSQNGSNPVFFNVLFVNNSAREAGAAVMASSDATFSSCLWYGNVTPDNAGAIYKNRSRTVQVNNSISWNNQASSDPDFNFSEGVHNSIFSDADGSDGNISHDPLFVDPANNIFHLQKGSPAIDAGANNLVPDTLIVDFAGFERIFGDNVDMGPFEHVQIEPVSPVHNGSGTKEFNMLMMLDLVWGITDGAMVPQTNIPSVFDYQLRLWKVGDEENLLEEGSFNARGAIEGSNNSTTIGSLEHGTAYQWSIGLDYDNYVVWSDPFTFFIGHDYTIKVKEGSTGTTGATWADAYGTLSEAVDFALPGDEIWVAAGTYYPVIPVDPNNVTQAERDEELSLKPGLVIYGGFAGDEGNASNRNHVENPTILSGDIGVAGDNSDNSVNLIRNEFEASAPLENGALIEGFIFEDATGSAIYNVNASPSVEFSIFRDNQGVYGGAVYNESSSPRFFNVLFHNNNASQSGGAIYGDEDSGPELLNCTVGNNSASSGGGLYGSSKVRNSIVYANEGGQIEGSSDVAFSCVEDGFDGEGNIQFDPVWKDAENHDYQLTEFSSCIDQGDGSLISALFSYDLAHNTRKHNFYVDMGAYEVQSIGKLEVVDSPLLNEEPIDFIDSITIRYNQPIQISADTDVMVSPAEEMDLKVSDEDNTVLVIKHTGLESATDYQVSLPYGYVELATNDMIVQGSRQFNFQTRACIPVALSVENPDVAVCPRTSVTLDADISGDALDYTWIFNEQDTLSTNVDSVFVPSVMPENAGTYTLKTTDWCGSSDEISLNLQYKAGTELIVPEPKWNTVYFVDNNTGNLSDIKWYLDGVEVSDKQYLDTKSMDVGELTVVAFDEASQCLIYGEMGQIKSASLKSAIVSPNPVASGNLVEIILPEVSEKSRIRLYDMRGAKLIDKEFVESSILQLEDTDFSSGVYLLQIEYNDGFIENKKLIIK